MLEELFWNGRRTMHIGLLLKQCARVECGVLSIEVNQILSDASTFKLILRGATEARVRKQTAREAQTRA